MAAWAATQAKAKFSEVLDRAESEGPQLVRRRKQEFLVLTRAQHEALKNHAGDSKEQTPKGTTKAVGTLGEFFRNSPLVGSGIKIRRVPLQPRHIDF